MKRMLLALTFGAVSFTPAFAQDINAMTCAEFAKQDNAGQMATIAAVQSAASQMQISETLMANDIHRLLTTKCTENPDMMVTEAATGMK